MISQPIKICFFTAARSDYFLLRPLLYRCQKDKRFNLKLIVGSMHVREDFGST